jgi:hypothetical protein
MQTKKKNLKNLKNSDKTIDSNCPAMKQKSKNKSKNKKNKLLKLQKQKKKV